MLNNFQIYLGHGLITKTDFGEQRHKTKSVRFIFWINLSQKVFCHSYK